MQFTVGAVAVLEMDPMQISLISVYVKYQKTFVLVQCISGINGLII